MHRLTLFQLVLWLFTAFFSFTSCWQLWTSEADGPGPRGGHSLLLFNDTVYLFGGRGNEKSVFHDPRTFSMRMVDGELEIDDYAGRPLKFCKDENGDSIDPDTMTPEELEACYNIDIGTYANDIWTYRLNCTRTADKGCTDDTWKLLFPGAHLGGCHNTNGETHCTHPQERWGHSTAVLWDREPVTRENRMLGMPRSVPAHIYVYGGYAQLCEDYCSDMWSFPLTDCLFDSTTCKWQKIAVLHREGPGKRWMAASSHDNTRWVLFGGSRLWHGFAKENSASNNWEITQEDQGSTYPYGGMLDDLWVFVANPAGVAASQYPDATHGVGMNLKFGKIPSAPPDSYEVSFGPVVSTDRGAWQQVLPRETCFKLRDTGVWDERRDIVCTIHWPSARMASAISLVRNEIFLFGGYQVTFPHPSSKSRGSSVGVSSLSGPQRYVYPALPVYLDDMWKFSFVSGVWEQISPRIFDDRKPLPRRGHTLVFANHVLLLFGGYSNNTVYNDLWIYNITTNVFYERETFIHPLLPDACTSDVYTDPVLNIEVPYVDTDEHGLSYPRNSVWGEPTRFTILDGKHGRSNSSVFISQTRRRAPGWDGCRDRHDGRLDLRQEMEWLRPIERQEVSGVWSETWKLFLIYGGYGWHRQEAPTTKYTHPKRFMGDFWVWGAEWCPSNCNSVGKCFYGQCFCNEGYYGSDCSNVTCPGSTCAYHPLNYREQCRHCCSAPYIHTDEDVYIAQLRKVPCEIGGIGVEHGICNGFGVCQCAPPFLGDDCSIRDCPNNCSSRGVCSAEYPVARCLCNPPYSGLDCSLMTCPNNCSYPNGACDLQTGQCKCAGLLNPYNRTEVFATYQGIDCSWVPAFAGSSPIFQLRRAILSFFPLLLCILFFIMRML